MPESLLDAKSHLEAQELHVSCADSHGLWIAAAVRDVGQGIKHSSDACSLVETAGQWVAIFPARGSLTYEVPGTLPDLVALILNVYSHYRRAGGSLEEAFLTLEMRTGDA